jgi:putative transposase
LSFADAAEKLETWRRYCNEERPHSAIGNKSPIMLVKSEGENSPPI